MTIQEFKKQAKETGRKVYSVRTRKNKHAEWYEITYAAIINENTVSVEQTKCFYDSLEEIISQFNS